MFESDRLFSQTNTITGLPQWFFHSREGEVGPFISKAQAQYAMHEYARFNADNGHDGGRSVSFSAADNLEKRLGHIIAADGNLQLGLVPLTGFIADTLQDTVNRFQH